MGVNGEDAYDTRSTGTMYVQHNMAWYHRGWLKNAVAKT